MRYLLPLCLSFLLVPLSFAETYHKRFTFKDTSDSSIESLLQAINHDTGLEFSSADFFTLEDRDLATSHYKMLMQTVAGVPVSGMSIRTWSDRKKGDLIQAEIELDTTAKANSHLMARKFSAARFNSKSLGSARLGQYSFKLAKDIVNSHPDDDSIHGFKSMDSWMNGDLVRTVTIRGRRGEHTINISLFKNAVISSKYSEFPQADADQYIDIDAKIFPIYEEAELSKVILPRIMSKLKYVKTQIADVNSDPYVVLRTQKYVDTKNDAFLGETVAGQAAGYWSTPMIKRKAYALAEKLPKKANSFENGLLLEGLYTSINYHPAALQGFPKIPFKLTPSSKFYPFYLESETGIELIPGSGLKGKLITAADEVLNRVARRLPDNDPTTLIADGFDEVQVYWAVTTLMESLAKNGFKDPELSTRPFNAFLFDPDIGMRNNAYYTDDTINFTTYSSEAQNYARDNSTIWHELGHGVMDRLMGDFIKLADTGGLSEGMADFCAALVIQDIMKDQVYPGSQDYRIINNTGFALTNEVHDDGESYGGTMRDILELSLKKFGPETGLAKMVDLTMETMRLTRNNPGLTAQGWFSHMLFADELSSEFRDAGDMTDIINQGLASRNFSWDGKNAAQFTVKNGDTVVTPDTEGSREHPIRLKLAPDEKVSYNLKVSLKSIPTYQFQYPVTVKVEYHAGALQGAIHWEGEEANPTVYTLNSEADELNIPLTASGTCDQVNQPDGSCKDYAYIQIYNNGKENQRPSAKKRFYLKISPKV
jgi:hypothetical protein